MALTQLAWSLVGPKIWSSGSAANIVPTKQQVMATYHALFEQATLWEIDHVDVTGSLYEAIIVRPLSSSATPNMRVIITQDATGSADFWQDRDFGAAETNAANNLQIGLTPDITENGGGSYTDGGFFSEQPFGSNVRWSKYWSVGDVSVENVNDLAFLIESQESVVIGYRGFRTALHAGFVGAILESFDASTGEEDGRVYGMITAGTTDIASFGNSSTTWLCNAGNVNAPHAGVFIVSGSSPNGPGGYDWVWMRRLDAEGYDGASVNSKRGEFTTNEFRLTATPISYAAVHGATQQYALGTLRQCYIIQDFIGLLGVVSGSASPFSPVGITFAGDFLNSTDAMLFANR